MISEGGDPPPLKLVKALICREFGALPEQVEDHPADTLFEYFGILNLFDEQVAKKQRRKK